MIWLATLKHYRGKRVISNSYCESGLGKDLFDKARKIVKESANSPIEEIKAKLGEVLGRSKVGFYAALDQLAFLEGIL